MLGQFRHGRVAGQPEDGRAAGVDRVEPGADPLGPGDQLPRDAGVGAALGVGRPDDGHGLGPEEPVQVGDGGVQRAAADVHVVRAWSDATGAGGVGVAGAVCRSKHGLARSCSKVHRTDVLSG